jgi:hypothetical protein
MKADKPASPQQERAMSEASVSFEFDQMVEDDLSGDQTARWLQQLRQAREQNARRLRSAHGSREFAAMQTFDGMLEAAERCLPKLWMELRGESQTPQSFVA